MKLLSIFVCLSSLSIIGSDRCLNNQQKVFLTTVDQVKKINIKKQLAILNNSKKFDNIDTSLDNIRIEFNRFFKDNTEAEDILKVNGENYSLNDEVVAFKRTIKYKIKRINDKIKNFKKLQLLINSSYFNNNKSATEAVNAISFHLNGGRHIIQKDDSVKSLHVTHRFSDNNEKFNLDIILEKFLTDKMFNRLDNDLLKEFRKIIFTNKKLNIGVSDDDLLNEEIKRVFNIIWSKKGIQLIEKNFSLKENHMKSLIVFVNNMNMIKQVGISKELLMGSWKAFEKDIKMKTYRLGKYETLLYFLNFTKDNIDEITAKHTLQFDRSHVKHDLTLEQSLENVKFWRNDIIKSGKMGEEILKGLSTSFISTRNAYILESIFEDLNKRYLQELKASMEIDSNFDYKLSSIISNRKKNIEKNNNKEELDRIAQLDEDRKQTELKNQKIHKRKEDAKKNKIKRRADKRKLKQENELIKKINEYQREIDESLINIELLLKINQPINLEINDLYASVELAKLENIELSTYLREKVDSSNTLTEINLFGLVQKKINEEKDSLKKISELKKEKKLNKEKRKERKNLLNTLNRNASNIFENLRTLGSDESYYTANNTKYLIDTRYLVHSKLFSNEYVKEGIQNILLNPYHEGLEKTPTIPSPILVSKIRIENGIQVRIAYYFMTEKNKIFILDVGKRTGYYSHEKGRALFKKVLALQLEEGMKLSTQK